MPRVTQRKPTAVTAPASFAFLTFLAATAAAGSARASDPLSTYVVPSMVELEPSEEAAVRVVIHGAFVQLASETNISYGDPRCGVMYFACVPGEEAMCRMQWKELRDAVSPTPSFCQGFGGLHVISTATIHDEGAPLGAPDSWDLGMGIGQGVYVDNKCPAALHLACSASASDGGADGDAASPNDGDGDGGGDGNAASPNDGGAAIDAPPSIDAGAPTDAAGGAPDVAAPPPHDAAADPPARTDGAADVGSPGSAVGHSGCVVAGSATASLPAAALAIAAVVVSRRRRRHEGR